MRRIESWRGRGTVEASNGQQTAVEYDLDVWQTEHHVRSMSGPSSTLPGMKAIRGTVQPVCYFGDNGLILTMEDGRRFKFFFTDLDGTIALNSWIG